MVVVVPGDCYVPLLFLGTNAVLVCLHQSVSPDDQPRCISFVLMWDKVCALVHDGILVLIQDKVSYCWGEVVCSIVLCQSVGQEFLLILYCFWWGNGSAALWILSILLKGLGVSGPLEDRCFWMIIGWFLFWSGTARP
jgi:hypothetical protein